MVLFFSHCVISHSGARNMSELWRYHESSSIRSSIIQTRACNLGYFGNYEVVCCMQSQRRATSTAVQTITATVEQNKRLRIQSPQNPQPTLLHLHKLPIQLPRFINSLIMPPPNLCLKQRRRPAPRLSRIFNHLEHFAHLID